MKPPKHTITFEQARTIRDIEQRLAELEGMRQRLERQMRDEADNKPLGRLSTKSAR